VSVAEQFEEDIGKDNGAIYAELDSVGITDMATEMSTQKLDATQAAQYKCMVEVFLLAAYKS
jgi:hypothetical protein